ncbi:MAG: putative PhzF superfamily epimerase YddE/YHI9 [Alphaproteobacteria bacterium]
MDLSIFQVDAFTDSVFGGNPAAVCPLDAWIADDVMQAIAAENNLAETAFFVANDNGYDLRWFTPTLEVELCGHATLASAFLIFERFARDAEILRFQTRSGELTVVRKDGLLFLDFPSYPGSAVDCPDALAGGLGNAPQAVIEGPNYMAVFESEADIAALAPNMEVLATLHPRRVIATAPGDAVDFVSRFFGPSFGVPEDPVTGSAHCMLTPYWAQRLGKTRLDARQISTRGGVLVCEDRGDRVGIGGQAVLYLEGKITV